MLLGEVDGLGPVLIGVEELPPVLLEVADTAIALASNQGPSPAAAHLALALIALSGLRPDEAARQLASVSPPREAARGLKALLAHAEAELHATQGRPDDGLLALDRFELTATSGVATPYEKAALGCLRARLHALAGDPERARSVLGEIAGEPWMIVAVLRARLLLAAGEPEAAIEALEGATTPVILARTRVERALLLAVALDQIGASERAARSLEEALALAEPSGHRWAFQTIGGSAEPLLRDRIRRGTRHRAFIGHLLDSLADPGCERPTITPPLEPLSEREQTILRYLPTSLSNKEMAAELFITTNTVKTHLRSIYRKLDVEHRRDAIERARELSLLTTSRL